ncbi:Murein hydrolase activator EnvC [Polaribacter huanghezhanensis]|uniref:murein hydrolase activator EnvC family protein n=1 Tax=Polaribacter huanghezhanensis TaxID=1354726 RepID=UPI002648B906|nr:peptidoglycan DD-metalloendopeptidase family protein [Polaribacter huanghezhanensis]WKD85570.1 Murein hydrolase activator EnvC [Polaribacter huanghezhanensis]
MKAFKLFFCFFLIALFSNNAVSQAQTKKQLEEKRQKLKQEISKVNKLLFTVQTKEKNALDALEDLNQKIVTRAAYIESINKEAAFLSSEIKQNERKITKLTKQLTALKKDYADMIFKSYKSKSKQSQLLFLMSSQSFQQAYKRVQYMKQYTKFRKKQGQEIVLQTDVIKKLNDSLLFKKQEKDTLIKVETEEKQKIEIDKKNKTKLVSQIKKKEKQYIKEIKAKQKEDRKIAAQIDKIIKDAIAKSNANKANKKSTSFALTPAAKALAKKFESNKGKLPWPVKSGLVVRKFGKQPHPTLRGITITSSGLHIATEKGATAQSVFNGKVLAIQVLSGGRKAVLIQHGNYITTYNNLETLAVNKGDNVVTGQVLGKIFTNKVTGKTTLIFVLHKETQRQNPTNWLLKR